MLFYLSFKAGHPKYLPTEHRFELLLLFFEGIVTVIFQVRFFFQLAKIRFFLLFFLLLAAESINLTIKAIIAYTHPLYLETLRQAILALDVFLADIAELALLPHRLQGLAEMAEIVAWLAVVALLSGDAVDAVVALLACHDHRDDVLVEERHVLISSVVGERGVDDIETLLIDVGVVSQHQTLILDSIDAQHASSLVTCNFLLLYKSLHISVARFCKNIYYIDSNPIAVQATFPLNMYTPSQKGENYWWGNVYIFVIMNRRVIFYYRWDDYNKVEDSRQKEK